MKLRNSLILTLSLLCSCVESVDKSKFNKPSDYSDADFQINENLDITFQFYQWAFSYDGLNYIKCDDVTSSDIKGPFKKEKDTNFELFLTDFYSRLEQSINVPWSIKLTPSGIIISLRDEHPLNASQPIKDTLLGIFMLLSWLHFSNALCEIAVTPSGMVTSIA